MNRILKGSIVLTLFTMAVSIFQISCKENVIAQAVSYVLPVATSTLLGGVKPDGTTILVDASGKISTAGNTAFPIATTTTLGGVKPDGTTVTVDGTGKISSTGIQQQRKILLAMDGYTTGIVELWVMNYDGTNKTQIPLTNLPQSITYVSSDISPDGQSVFILGYDSFNGNKTVAYTMSTTGTNAKQILDYAQGSTVGPRSLRVY